MKMYKVSRWGIDIQEIIVDRVTDKCVYLTPYKRESFQTRWYEWCKTRRHAVHVLKQRYLDKISQAEKEIVDAKKMLKLLNERYPD